MIGLKHSQNLLVDYDPAWPLLFAQEQAQLRLALPGLARGIEHYGSTAVPGLQAKPIIDILVGILPLDDWARCKQPLEALGYDYAAHAGVPGHFIFGRGRDTRERTHLVHVVAFEGASWRFNLAFRDALRNDAELRRRYLAHKQVAAQNAPEGRAAYNERKQHFFANLKLADGQQR